MPDAPLNDPPPDEDIRLLQLTGEGDRDAFSRLYDRYAPILLATAFTILDNREAAEDVLQDVFLTLWEKAPLYDPTRGRPLTWALTMTRNRSIDRLRSLHRRRRLHHDAAREALTSGPVQDDHDSFAALLGAERKNRVQAALQELNPDQRQAIEMTFFLSLTQTEIAEQLNAPLGTVKARIRRGLLKLRELLMAEEG